MKVLVISDIHGSSYYAKKIKEINKKEEPDKIIVLGDLYYHGPRNELTQEYKPMEVAKILNSLKEKLIVIKGNCDSEVDQTISEFDFKENVEININGYNVFLTHGHKYNMDRLPPLGIKMDIMMYGHFHEGFIIEENGIIFANPGSISLRSHSLTLITYEEFKILIILLYATHVCSSICTKSSYRSRSRRYRGTYYWSQCHSERNNSWNNHRH